MLVLVLLCMAGCKQDTQPIRENLTHNGIEFHFPIHVTSTTNGEVSTFAFKNYTLSLTEKNGKLTVNGKECGTVKAGDTVVIDGEGRVSVNGAPRDPR